MDATHRKKIVFIGREQVGKSAIIKQFMIGQFDEEYVNTEEERFEMQYSVDGREVFIEIVDISGYDTYDAMKNKVMQTAHGVILVFSIVNKSSFDYIKDYASRLKASRRDKVYLVLVGCKVDLDIHRTVSKEHAQELAKTLECPYIEVSASDNSSVTEAILLILRQILKEELPKSKLSFKKCCVLQ